MSQITVLTPVLREVVAIASSFVGKRREGAAACLRFSAQRDGLTVSSIGQDNQLLTQVLVCECSRSLDVLIPPKRLGQILATVREEQITILQQDGSVKIKAPSCQFTLATEDPQDFPEIDNLVPDYSEASVSVVAMSRSLQHTMSHCDQNSARYALGGVMFELSPTGTTVVATDSRRMLISERRDVKTIGGSVRFIMPHAVCKSLVSLLQHQPQDGTISLRANLKKMSIVGDGFCLVTPGVEGRFPEWRSLMSAQNGDLVMSVTVAALRRSCRLAGVMTSEEHRGIVFDLGGENIEIRSRNEVGESSVLLDAEIKNAITTEVVAQYVLEAIAGFEEHEIVEWRQNNSVEPLFLHLPDEMVCLIMPLQHDG